MSAERPPITEEHLTFSQDIAKLGGAMSRVTVERVVERFGEPPTKAGQDLLRFGAYFLVPFSNQGKYRHSRFHSGNIAGSSDFVFKSTSLTDDVFELLPDDIQDHDALLGDFPSRVTEMRLLYKRDEEDDDPHYWDARLITGPETPPVLVDTSILSEALVDNSRLPMVGEAQDKLPAGSLHYLEASELPLIKDGLAMSMHDLDMRGVLANCRQNAAISKQTEEAAWFTEQLSAFPSQHPPRA